MERLLIPGNVFFKKLPGLALPPLFFMPGEFCCQSIVQKLRMNLS